MPSRIAVLSPLALCLFFSPAFGQLTTEQKITDFLYIADSYAVQYGPYHWKRDAVGFNPGDLRPWLDRIRRTANDIEYAELLVDYTSSLDDAHVSISFPFNYSGSLGFTVDIYDGKVLIDSINRTRLPVARFPFQIGDEIVAMDGVPAAELVRRFGKYAIAANPGSTSRSAAARLTSRNQSNMPSLTSLPENSSVEMRRANGENQFFDIPWLITGQPTTSFGRVFTPGPRTAQAQNNAWIQDNSLDPHQEHIREFLNASVDPSHSAILNFGGRSPIFALPQGFVQRFGRDQADFFFSGTFNASGLRIGFIRIPSFSPPNATLALQQFEQEMRFFEENTDGLIVDDMRNPGGSVAFIEGIAQRLHPSQFRILGFEIRATAGWVFSFISRLNTARATNQPQWVISLLEEALAQVRQANSEPGGRTGPISLNSTGGLELVPHPLAYSKPILCLVDEFSASAGDMLPAILQDNRRALLFGTRTMGAGGNVVNYNNAGPSEASFRVTQSLMHRREPVITPEYPAAPYVENIGVRPDILADYMTRENLMTNGSSFVEAFTAAIVAHIRASR